MAEWYFEDGIGEARAALVDHGDIIEAHIEPHDLTVSAGMVCDARLVEIPMKKRLGLLELDNEDSALLDSLPGDIAEGASLRVEIARAALPEPGRRKRQRAKPAAKGKLAQAAPRLLERIRATDIPVRTLAIHDPETLESVGWSELLEQAATGAVRYPGGTLRISLTPP